MTCGSALSIRPLLRRRSNALARSPASPAGRWQALFGRSVPEHLTAGLLRRMIANRIQDEAFGTLDRDTLKILDGLAARGAQSQW